MENLNPPPMDTEDKTTAIVSYLTLIGLIVAIIMHTNKKTKLGAFHLRQVLGLFLTAIVGWVCVAITMFVLLFLLAFLQSILVLLVPLIYFAFGLSIFVLWVMGFIAALNGEMKPLPLVGAFYQKLFSNAFA